MKDTINVNCPVAATLQLIGGKYKALLLWHLSGKILRFNELRRLVPEATPKMLTQQLRELEGDGLIARKVYAVVPPKVEYSLTPRGESLFPILQAMYAWGSKLLEGEGICPECSMKPLEAEHCCCHNKTE
ncbi:winged helix-turn-helix transcriptional regulator [Phascolarctobacterium succinatutens]|uniref:winged helix-turn-helix transcriptional regulator n=1 Tax=Phascolarctobacterium succinatutens TaxID=626940 RepID=UPI0026EEAD35|nr:helix-turn-helix domain-containing protein [Phascolarctobacterium succinatutens]